MGDDKDAAASLGPTMRRLLLRSAPVLMVGTVAILSPLTASTIPAVLVPTGYLFYHNSIQSPPFRADPTLLFGTYLSTGLPGSILTIVAQGLLVYPAARLLFRHQTSTFLAEFGRGEAEVGSLPAETIAFRRALASDPRTWVLNFILTFIAAGLGEEALKYIALRLLRRWYGPKIKHERQYITYGAAVALGFATIEAVGYIYGAVAGGERGWKLALTVAERVAFGAPGHVLQGIMVAVGFIRKDVRGEDRSLLDVLGLPVFFHGAFNFALFAVSGFYGNVGWVHPRDVKVVSTLLGIATVWLGTMAVTVRGQLASLGA